MVDRVAFYIGPLAVYWYGIIIMSGTVIATYIFSLQLKAMGYDSDHAWNALTFCLILGLIGARLYHVFTPSPSMGDPLYYFHNPLEIFNVRNGGLGIYGGIIGGGIALIIYTRHYSLDTWEFFDLASPSVALGQAIGRWGNFFNQELYGRPTDLPWGIYIEPANRLFGYEQYGRFHPTFLYESILNLIVFLVLTYMIRKKYTNFLKGEVFCIYIVLYSMVRFFLEFVRLDSPKVGVLAIAQFFALTLILIIVIFSAYRRIKEK